MHSGGRVILTHTHGGSNNASWRFQPLERHESNCGLSHKGWESKHVWNKQSPTRLCECVRVCVKSRDPIKQSLINHHYIFAASFSSKLAPISLSRELHPDDPCFWWVLPPTNVATKTVSFCFMTNKSSGNTNKARNVSICIYIYIHIYTVYCYMSACVYKQEGRPTASNQWFASGRSLPWSLLLVLAHKLQ